MRFANSSAQVRPLTPALFDVVVSNLAMKDRGVPVPGADAHPRTTIVGILVLKSGQLQSMGWFDN